MRGRNPHSEPYRNKTFYLPVDLCTQVDLKLKADLLRGGTAKYGEWGKLVTRLLREWLERENNATTPTQSI